MRVYLVLVRCDAFKNESATPDDAMSAAASAVVEPIPSRRFPIVFHNAISKWRPPRMTTNCLTMLFISEYISRIVFFPVTLKTHSLLEIKTNKPTGIICQARAFLSCAWLKEINSLELPTNSNFHFDLSELASSSVTHRLYRRS